MRGALVAAAVLAAAGLVVQGPARAQVAVEGGGSFNDAPLVAPGSYSDRIKPTEVVYWAFEVARGQTFTVSTTITVVPGDSSSAGAGVTLRTHAPDRDQADFAVASFDGSRPTSLTLKAGGQPGRWFASLQLAGDAALAGRDFPVQLNVAVEGAALAPTTTATVPSTTTSITAASPASEDAGAHAAPRVSWWPERVAGFGIGLVAGFGIVRALRRRPARGE